MASGPDPLRPAAEGQNPGLRPIATRLTAVPAAPPEPTLPSSADTLQRLASQLEALSQVVEALTYRLLDLEERLAARDDRAADPADPPKRIG